MEIKLEDHSDEVLAALESACAIALETCGLVGDESDAYKKMPDAERTQSIPRSK